MEESRGWQRETGMRNRADTVNVHYTLKNGTVKAHYCAQLTRASDF